MAYGVVGLFCNFKELQLDNPNNFEVLPAIGSVQGLSRKVALLGCYIPPNYTTARAASCLRYIEELVIELKRRLKDPMIIVSGDFLINGMWRTRSRSFATYPKRPPVQPEGTGQLIGPSQILNPSRKPAR